MARFLIEVEHGAEKAACLEAMHILVSSGSHYLTNAEFGGTPVVALIRSMVLVL